MSKCRLPEPRDIFPRRERPTCTTGFADLAAKFRLSSEVLPGERNSQTDWRRRQSRANYSPLRTRKNTGKTPLSRQFREPSSPGTAHPSRSYNQDMDGGISSEQGITGLASAASRFSGTTTQRGSCDLGVLALWLGSQSCRESPVRNG